MAVYKVIFHIHELGHWKTALANVANLLADMPNETLEIIVLANGDAVHYLNARNDIETNIEKMKKLSNRDVHFIGCNNSLKNNGITEEKLYPFVEVVPAGVGELVRKQNEGYAYIYV